MQPKASIFVQKSYRVRKQRPESQVFFLIVHASCSSLTHSNIQIRYGIYDPSFIPRHMHLSEKQQHISWTLMHYFFTNLSIHHNHSTQISCRIEGHSFAMLHKDKFLWLIVNHPSLKKLKSPLVTTFLQVNNLNV